MARHHPFVLDNHRRTSRIQAERIDTTTMVPPSGVLGDDESHAEEVEEMALDQVLEGCSSRPAAEPLSHLVSETSMRAIMGKWTRVGIIRSHYNGDVHARGLPRARLERDSP
jgi:hypothetical protein